MCGVAHGVSLSILHHLHGQRFLQRRIYVPGRDRSQGPRRRDVVLHVLPLTLKASRRGLGLQRPCSQGFLKNPVYDGMLGVRMASIHPPCPRSPVDAWEANPWWTSFPHCPQQPVHWASKKYERGWPSLRRCDCSPSSRLQVCQSLQRVIVDMMLTTPLVYRENVGTQDKHAGGTP